MCKISFGQYKYTRFSLDINAGPALPITSVPGALSIYSELGLKGTLSRYLAGRGYFGYGSISGSREVTQKTSILEEVGNYTQFKTTYYYIGGAAYLNLEKVFNLRNSIGIFKRLNPFLVVGGGFMFPDIKVNRIDGQFKNYKKNVRFYTQQFGLDFRQFLSNQFDLTFGADYVIVQSYYLDGAYSDKKLDGLLNAHIGISYNIGASADRKNMDWYNLDGKVDVIFAPEEKQLPEPVTQNYNKDSVESESIITQNTPEETPEPEIQIEDSAATPSDIIITDVVETTVTDTSVTGTITAEPAYGISSNPVATVPYKKVGRHVDIRPDGTPKTPQKPEQPKIIDSTSATAKAPTSVTLPPPSLTTSLNDIDGIVRPLGKYNVIVGTYAGSKYAYLFRNKLRKQGMEAALFKSSDRSKMIRVAVYYGDNKAEALKQLRKYQAKFNGQAWIHVYDPK